jgi:hypothetical protein
MTQTQTGTSTMTQTPSASPVVIDASEAAAAAVAATSAQVVPLAAGIGGALVFAIAGGVAFNIYDRKVRADLRIRKLKAAARAVNVRSTYGAVASDGAIAVREPATLPSVVLYKVGASSKDSGGRGGSGGQVSVVVGGGGGGVGSATGGQGHAGSGGRANPDGRAARAARTVKATSAYV